DTAAHLAASQQRVSHRNDVAGQRYRAFHSGLERHSPVLAVAHHHPFTAPLSLRRPGAADRADLGGLVAETPLQRGVGIR
nr:hypothetical protein [Tanacetum cinerariifolium]